MDAEAEDKTLRTRAKGTKGELASRFHDTVLTTPWNVGVPCSVPDVWSEELQLPQGFHF